MVEAVRFRVREMGTPMMTFNVVEVRGLTAGITARMPDLSMPMEGMEYARMDAILRGYAGLCREFCGHVRNWGNDVFSGRLEFDPEVERLWQVGGSDVHRRATWALQCGLVAEEEGNLLEELASPRDAVDDLGRLLERWVTPKLAVGPAARRWRYPDQAATEEEQRQVASLSAISASRALNGSAQRGSDKDIRAF